VLRLQHGLVVDQSGRSGSWFVPHLSVHACLHVLQRLYGVSSTATAASPELSSSLFTAPEATPDAAMFGSSISDQTNHFLQEVSP